MTDLPAVWWLMMMLAIYASIRAEQLIYKMDYEFPTARVIKKFW